MSRLSHIPTRELFGIRIHAATMADAVRVCAEAIEDQCCLQIGVVNAAKLVRMQQDPELHAAVADCGLILADGMAVVWAARLLRQPLPERVTGIDLFVRLLELAHERSYRVYFLGARPDVLAAVTERVAATYPALHIAGGHHGYFADEDAQAVAEEISAARPHILFVAMTSPRKELFLNEWAARMHVNVCHGVGGSFDVFAGRVQRAPESWQNAGLEWLYRVLQEPRRMWRRYLTSNAAFAAMLLAELWRRVARGSRSRV